MVDPAWEKGLRNSAVFLCLVTKAYLRSPECWEQIALARRLGKPCRAIIKKGTRVPRGFFDGFDDIRYYSFRTERDLARIAKQIGAELGKGHTYPSDYPPEALVAELGTDSGDSGPQNLHPERLRLGGEVQGKPWHPLGVAEEAPGDKHG